MGEKKDCKEETETININFVRKARLARLEAEEKAKSEVDAKFKAEAEEQPEIAAEAFPKQEAEVKAKAEAELEAEQSQEKPDDRKQTKTTKERKLSFLDNVKSFLRKKESKVKDVEAGEDKEEELKGLLEKIEGEDGEQESPKEK